MHPAVIVEMDEFPLTLGGKTDRRALPPPRQLPRTADAPYEAARTPVEALLTDLLADALALQEVGIHDDFFEIGGNSLLAMDILAHLRGALRVDLPPTELFFENPTIAQLAEMVGGSSSDADTAAGPADSASTGTSSPGTAATRS
ncbi:phosphopantetheine-binding protein [Plantactinospora sp. KBS50]|uniref:phosphopantetheine-binding protein n=1 Tax=Plantactinospora sp. KBS50 TaxID=2024580 RepID=UPI003514A51F